MKNVLIIEDNPAMLRALEDNFTLKGFNVTVARDGQTGLKAVLARDEILNSALGCTHFISASDINSFIETIREKVEPDLQKPRFIHSMGKTGYKFEPV